jgi:hypothetical protein
MGEPTMGNFQLMDKILFDLKDKNKSIMEFEADFPDKVVTIDDCLQELLSFELVEIWAEAGGGTFMITSNGKKFINSGSFEQQALVEQEKTGREAQKLKQEEDRKDIQFNWKARDEKRKNLTIGLALLTFCLTIWNIYIQVTNSRNLDKSALVIDTFKTNIKTSLHQIDSIKKITKTAPIKIYPKARSTFAEGSF